MDLRRRNVCNPLNQVGNNFWQGKEITEEQTWAEPPEHQFSLLEVSVAPKKN